LYGPETPSFLILGKAGKFLMFGKKSCGKYLNFKNEVRDFGVRRDESWISVTIVFVPS
jgi:hypothetical protein